MSVYIGSVMRKVPLPLLHPANPVSIQLPVILPSLLRVPVSVATFSTSVPKMVETVMVNGPV